MWILDISADRSGRDAMTSKRDCAEAKKKGRKELFGTFLPSSEVQPLPEERGSDRNGVVVDLLTDLVFGDGSDVLSLYFHPIGEVVTGEADPGLVVLNQA